MKKQLQTVHKKNSKNPHHEQLLAKHKTSRFKARKRKDLRIIATIVIVLLVVIAGSLLLFIKSSPSSKNAERQEGAKDVVLDLLGSQVSTAEYRTITSTLGMAVKYNNTTIEATGQTTDASSTSTYVSGISYENDELTEPRDYSILNFAIREAEKRSSFISEDTVLTVLTNIRKDFLTNRLSDPKNSGLGALEIITKETIEKQASNGFTLLNQSTEQIGSVAYEVVNFEKKTGYGNFISGSYLTYYLTIQNERPYYIGIRSNDASDRGAITQLEAIIKAISYSLPDQGALSSKSTVSLVGDEIELPEESSYIPEKLDEDTLVDVVLRNQPSVVRIGALKCADIKLASGSASKVINDACAAGVGSGSLITEDGYIATNGHVAVMGDTLLLTSYLSLSSTYEEFIERSEDILDFFVESNNLTSSDKNGLVTGLNNGTIDPSNFIISLEEQSAPFITLQNENSEYVIQTSNDPIRLKMDQSRFEFEYNDTNISAEYVDSNYDSSLGTARVDLSSITSTDVAILKANGSFPVVPTGDFSSLEYGDQLTAIGYPAFIDDGLSTTKEKTVPSITQGVIDQIYTDPSNTYQLAFTNVPISGGNSGGPAFDDNGKQVGLNTYGMINCPGGECFGDGVARNMRDLLDLAKENDISINGKSGIRSDWDKGLDAFLVGNFKEAANRFSKVTDKYPAHYLAASLLKSANNKIGTAEDLSDTFAKSPLPIYIASGSAAAAVVLAVVGFLILRKHRKSHGSARKLPLQPLPNNPYVWQQEAVANAGYQQKHPPLQQPTIQAQPALQQTATNPSKEVIVNLQPPTAPAQPTVVTVKQPASSTTQNTPQATTTPQRNPYAWQQEAVANARKIAIKDE